MRLYIDENIPSHSLILNARDNILTEKEWLILLIFGLTILEIPIFYILIKSLTGKTTESFLFLIGMPLIISVIFLMVILTAPPKLFSLKAKKREKFLELGFIRYLFFKTKKLISYDEIGIMKIFLYNIKGQKKVRMEIETTDKGKIATLFTLEALNLEDVAEIFHSLSIIIGFKSYTAYPMIEGYTLQYSKGLEGKNKIEEGEGIIFEKDGFGFKEMLQIPYLLIKELNPAKIVLYKKSGFYDIFRPFTILIFIPLFYVTTFLNQPHKTVLIVVLFAFFIFTLYLMRRLISPMETVIDRINRNIKIRKLIFTVTVPFSHIKEIEITDEVPRRTGTIIFHVDVKLTNDRRHQLFYTEFPRREEEIYRVFESVMRLVEYISKTLALPAINKTRHL